MERNLSSLGGYSSLYDASRSRSWSEVFYSAEDLRSWILVESRMGWFLLNVGSVGSESERQSMTSSVEPPEARFGRIVKCDGVMEGLWYSGALFRYQSFWLVSECLLRLQAFGTTSCVLLMLLHSAVLASTQIL